MPEISRFFGIIIRMFYDDHNPPHFHVEFQGNKAVVDFQTKLVREWVDLHQMELEENWQLAQEGREIKKIDPLD